MDIGENVRYTLGYMIAILHDVRSLHNVGSMFRTADGAGIEKLYLCGITPTPLDAFGRVRSQLGKVALGAESFVPWEYKKDTVRLIDALQRRGYTVCAVEQDDRAIPYTKARTANGKKTVFIVGPEVEGLPERVLDRVDRILEIPMQGKKESLNVSVAFGIIAYELCRKK